MLYTKEQYQYLRLTLSFRVQLVDWFEEFDSESRRCHRQRGWNQDARKWPILPFDVSWDFIISKEILV